MVRTLRHAKDIRVSGSSTWEIFCHVQLACGDLTGLDIYIPRAWGRPQGECSDPVDAETFGRTRTHAILECGTVTGSPAPLVNAGQRKMYTDAQSHFVRENSPLGPS